VLASKTKNLNFEPYQQVATEFPDIPLKEFKKASRLIEPDGKIFSGPDSGYRALCYLAKPKEQLHHWYHQFRIFRNLSDNGYNFTAKNRPMMMKLTKAFFGSNPLRRRPFWIMWLTLLGGTVLATVKIFR